MAFRWSSIEFIFTHPLDGRILCATTRVFARKSTRSPQHYLRSRSTLQIALPIKKPINTFTPYTRTNVREFQCITASREPCVYNDDFSNNEKYVEISISFEWNENDCCAPTEQCRRPIIEDNGWNLCYLYFTRTE